MNLPNLPSKQTALCEWRSEAPDRRDRAGVWRAGGCELLQGQRAESGTGNSKYRHRDPVRRSRSAPVKPHATGNSRVQRHCGATEPMHTERLEREGCVPAKSHGHARLN